MRNPTALDAMARWLVLTLAGVGLFALIPGSSFAAPGFASTRWLFSLHPVQLVAVVMIIAAWVLFVVHLAVLGGPWMRDLPSIALAVLALVSVGASAAAFTWGTTTSIVTAFLVSVGLHVALCLRIDRIARHGLPGRPTTVARKRRAATAL